MAKNDNLTDFLVSVANKLRECLNTEEKINPQDFETKISEVFEKKQSDFWDYFQNFGKRRDYSSAFKNAQYGLGENMGWCKKTFFPKYDIKPTLAQEMFRNFEFREEDFGEYLKNLGVKIDFSQCTNFEMAFYNSFVNCTLPVIDMTSAENTTYTFRGCNAVGIEKLIFSGDKKYSADMFSGKNKLKNVVFEGVLQSSMDVSTTLFTHDTLVSLISVLKDFSESDTTCTLTLGEILKAKLSAEEIEKATAKGWQIK